MSLDDIMEIVESGSAAIFCIFIGIVIATVIILKRKRRKYGSIPVKTVTARLVKTADYVGDASAETAEHRQSYTTGRYEYWLDGKRHTKTIKTAYGGSLKNEITLYYKKGNRDVSLDANVIPSSGGYLFLVFYFAVICPALAGGVWVLFKTLSGI